MNSGRHYPSMLRMAIATLSVFLIFSCDAPVKDDKALKDAMPADSVAANVRFYAETWDAVINQGRVSLLDTAFSSDIVIRTSPADIHGIDSSKAFYANYVTGFSERQFIVKDIFGQGDEVFKYWVFKGKHTGEFMGIKPTGKVISVEGATVAHLRNGKIVEERDFFDNLEFMQQLGLIPR